MAELPAKRKAPLPPQFLTPDDLCSALRVTSSTLANWRSQKTGPPFFRIGGGLVRYDPDEFAAWVATQRVT